WCTRAKDSIRFCLQHTKDDRLLLSRGCSRDFVEQRRSAGFYSWRFSGTDVLGCNNVLVERIHDCNRSGA
ncbi:hypothetical protein VIGAN_10203600, partial [Vigna angularis var. angularis]